MSFLMPTAVHTLGASTEDTGRTHLWSSDDDPTIDRGTATTIGEAPASSLDGDDTSPFFRFEPDNDPTIDQAATSLRGIPLRTAPGWNNTPKAPVESPQPLAADGHRWIERHLTGNRAAPAALNRGTPNPTTRGMSPPIASRGP